MVRTSMRGGSFRGDSFRGGSFLQPADSETAPAITSQPALCSRILRLSIQPKMTAMVRVRFAPSPTGYLHVGGARTALFNWLLARRHGGVFVLRIEDTDVARSSTDMVEGILDGLRWLGLDWSEGPIVGGPHEPYFQSERLDRHRAMAERLVASGHAYCCYCTPEELKAKREAAERAGGAWQYDRTCYALTKNQINAHERENRPRVVRVKVPSGPIAFTDLVHGTIEVDGANVEDFVILRSDGLPTYHLSVRSEERRVG